MIANICNRQFKILNSTFNFTQFLIDRKVAKKAEFLHPTWLLCHRQGTNRGVLLLLTEIHTCRLTSFSVFQDTLYLVILSPWLLLACDMSQTFLVFFFFLIDLDSSKEYQSDVLQIGFVYIFLVVTLGLLILEKKTMVMLHLILKNSKNNPPIQNQIYI